MAVETYSSKIVNIGPSLKPAFEDVLARDKLRKISFLQSNKIILTVTTGKVGELITLWENPVANTDRISVKAKSPLRLAELRFDSTVDALSVRSDGNGFSVHSGGFVGMYEIRGKRRITLHLLRSWVIEK